jgi:hypothetical protein
MTKQGFSETPKPQKTVTVSFKAPVDLLAQIDRLAKDERRSRGNAIRLLLDEALQQRLPRDSANTLRIAR